MAAAILTHRLDEREPRAALGTCPRNWTLFRYSRQFGTSGTRSMPNVPPRLITRATDSSVVREIAFANERLQDAIRREDHREASPAKRQIANVGASASAVRDFARLVAADRAWAASDRRRRDRRRSSRAESRRVPCRSRVRGLDRRRRLPDACQNDDVAPAERPRVFPVVERRVLVPALPALPRHACGN